MNIKHLKLTTNEVEICGLSLLLIPFLSLLLATTAFIFGGGVGAWRAEGQKGVEGYKA